MYTEVKENHKAQEALYERVSLTWQKCRSREQEMNHVLAVNDHLHRQTGQLQQENAILKQELREHKCRSELQQKQISHLRQSQLQEGRVSPSFCSLPEVNPRIQTDQTLAARHLQDSPAVPGAENRLSEELVWSLSSTIQL